MASTTDRCGRVGCLGKAARDQSGRGQEQGQRWGSACPQCGEVDRCRAVPRAYYCVMGKGEEFGVGCDTRSRVWAMVGVVLVGCAVIGAAGLGRSESGLDKAAVGVAIVGVVVIARAVRDVVVRRWAVREAGRVHELWREVRYCEGCDGVFLPGAGESGGGGERGEEGGGEGVGEGAGKGLMKIEMLHKMLCELGDLVETGESTTELPAGTITPTESRVGRRLGEAWRCL